MKTSPINGRVLVRISRIMAMGLRSGRDWASVLYWISESDPNPSVRLYLSSWLQRLRLDSVENILREERSRSQDLLWNIFIEILLQANHGSTQLSRLLQMFSETCRSLIQLKQKEKSLLFIPKFQSWASLVITLGFTLGLPILAPGVFPTFLTQGRQDLFLAGISCVVLGFILLHWLCTLPRRRLFPKVSVVFFLYLLSIYLESGLDFVSGWGRASDAVEFSRKVKSKIKRSGLHIDTIDSFLRDLSHRLQSPWPEILVGILWAKNSGSHLSQYLKEASVQEREDLLLSWDDEIRKLTIISLIPMGLLIFPGTLFLLVGPQFLDLLKTL